VHPSIAHSYQLSADSYKKRPETASFCLAES
jgi:hypothetical protein